MSISSISRSNVACQTANPVKENSRPSRNGGGATCMVVSLIALAIIGVLAAGIALTTIGALSANPVFLNIGICLLVGGILGLIKGCISCRS